MDCNGCRTLLGPAEDACAKAPATLFGGAQGCRTLLTSPRFVNPRFLAPGAARTSRDRPANPASQRTVGPQRTGAPPRPEDEG